MDKNVLLTIIVPHYNTPNLLIKLLKTIPNRPEVQVIVVDDASNKDTNLLDKCILDFSNKNIEFYKNMKNMGAGICRNIAIDKANGKWILFADADDFFLEGLYKKVSIYFDSSYDIVYFTPTSINLDTNKKGVRHIELENIIKLYLKKPDKLYYELKLRYSINGPCSKLIRTSIIINNRLYFDKIKSAEDVMFIVKVTYLAKKIYATKEIIYCISRHNNSMTTDLSFDKYYINLNVFIRKYLFLKNNLNYKNFRLLNMNASCKIISAIINKYKINNLIIILKVLKDNKIKIFSINKYSIQNMLIILYQKILLIIVDLKYCHKDKII